MDDRQFDVWTKHFTVGRPSRRIALRGIASAALGGLAASLSQNANAKRRKKKRKKEKVAFNAFGCVDVGKFCKNGEQCCSGICQGKKDKKTCQAHDQSTCQAGQPSGPCADADIACTTSSGDEGFCNTTTGNAGYCASAGGCFACTRDADCNEQCGPGAACVPCADECQGTGGTACFGIGLCQF